jgi:transcriptional regulator with XRE-family HTH domain
MGTQRSPDARRAPFGEHLRHWRQRRRLSQLELSAAAAISTRHLSFVETGRSLPSREVVLRLSERLEIPLRERNAMLMAAGYAPMFRERPLDDPALAAARRAVDLVLAGHEPFPALAIDRHWNMVAHNRIVPHLLGGIDATLLQPPLNGWTSRFRNWRSKRCSQRTTRRHGSCAACLEAAVARPRRAQASSELIAASTAAPGHRSASPSWLSGVWTVFRFACRFGAAAST